MAIQIGKYKRPGIFIEEFDRSVFTSPTVEGITNLVIGVSKKGPVNDIVRITNINDLESIFGPLDRSLERKGSFFHRTISKMLETSPIFALNLLKTDDLLDVIEYKSVSSSSGYNNDIKRTGPYRRFFDTTGFWKRDTESFINLTKDDLGYEERVLNFTNLSDKNVSIFVFKTQREGFDTPLLDWYGSVDKLPPYLNANDYASDYMVDVVVVGGDWSNYQDLSVDPKWSQYFNTSGLRKEQIRNFANDNNVSLLNYYEGLSLIPFFRDNNGRDIFIENNINADTDRTGLFCSFNVDLVETDFRNATIDLIGHTIAGENETDIEFLSYKETIAESIRFDEVSLDTVGNVTSFNGGITTGNRTSTNAEGIVSGVSQTDFDTSDDTKTIIEYNIDPGAFAIIGDAKIDIPEDTLYLEISVGDYPVISADTNYVSAVVLDNTGVIKLVNNTTGHPTQYNGPVVSTTDIVLSCVKFTIANGLTVFSSVTIESVTVDDTDYVDLEAGTDYTITESATEAGVITVVFTDTNNTPDTSIYNRYRKFKAFNRLISILDSPNSDKVTMLVNGGDKLSLSGMTLSDVETSSTQNKSFKLDTGLSATDLAAGFLDDVLTTGGGNGTLTFYTEDNEMILGTDSVISKSTQADTDIGVIGKYSDLYTKFFDGVINTGDFFYGNKIPDSISLGSVDVNFLNGENADIDEMTYDPSHYAGNDYLVFSRDMELNSFDKLIFPTSLSNKGTFTIVNNTNNATPSVTDNPTLLAEILGFTGGEFAYKVNENTTDETIEDVDYVYDVNKKHYLKMYLEDSDIKIEFVDELLSSTVEVDEGSTPYFSVESRSSNFKQTIEIEVPTGYTRVSNKILVKADRYTEVKVGDFLSAYYNSSELEVGESPRTLTRILSKRAYSGDSSLVEITCDSKISVSKFGPNDDLQTTRYMSIDNYVSTYKCTSLKGFRLRNDSLPNGSEEKQNEILNLVAKGTPLFKALTNKEAVDFRYLIDSFGLGLTERSKQQLIDICGNRLDAFGIISAPSVKQLKNSTSPTFVDSEGVFQTSFLKTGGDLESNPAFLFSLADGTGVTSGAYFGPYVTVNDNGRPLSVPPAPYIASTFMRKHLSSTGSITPWTIAAGVRDGRVTNIANIEIQYTPEDIENLNAAKINPIVFKRNRGYVIETENTAQTLLSSSLSYIHVREALIELERELSNMLVDYQWRYNTPDVRAEIKLRADTICETFVSKNGIFNYFNKMDDENNTTEIIENQIGVLDTYVEPIFGMGIIVNNITILRPGSISSGGFIQS